MKIIKPEVAKNADMKNKLQTSKNDIRLLPESRRWQKRQDDDERRPNGNRLDVNLTGCVHDDHVRRSWRCQNTLLKIKTGTRIGRVSDHLAKWCNIKGMATTLERNMLHVVDQDCNEANEVRGARGRDEPNWKIKQTKKQKRKRRRKENWRKSRDNLQIQAVVQLDAKKQRIKKRR